MEKTWILVLSLFLIITFFFWKFTHGYFKKEYGKRLWNQWTTRLFYWQGVIYTSTGITILLFFILKWLNVVTF
ncbi:hypothetical protein BD809_10716 [Aquimarina intermedia]|uniref:Immunity protein 17 of polymorphic toxin system n=1 Tax=Aquimarina intermedia TaxID=350814 RepID=A0A5S5C0Z2_9FLAO|nr:hypothetical protein BD809_10716 [Aquimarina intermedia]